MSSKSPEDEFRADCEALISARADYRTAAADASDARTALLDANERVKRADKARCNYRAKIEEHITFRGPF